MSNNHVDTTERRNEALCAIASSKRIRDRVDSRVRAVDDVAGRISRLGSRNHFAELIINAIAEGKRYEQS